MQSSPLTGPSVIHCSGVDLITGLHATYVKGCPPSVAPVEVWARVRRCAAESTCWIHVGQAGGACVTGCFMRQTLLAQCLEASLHQHASYYVTLMKVGVGIVVWCGAVRAELITVWRHHLTVLLHITCTAVESWRSIRGCAAAVLHSMHAWGCWSACCAKLPKDCTHSGHGCGGEPTQQELEESGCMYITV
jgi:hypothetical protein